MRLLFDESGMPPKSLTEPDLERLYEHPLGPSGRWIRTNFVTTLDGAVHGPDGRTGSINTESDHHLFALQRALSDVILVGAGTVRVEGYRAVDLAPWQTELRLRLGLSPCPALAVVTASLRLSPSLTTPVAGPGGPVLVITTEDHSEPDLEPLRQAGMEIRQTGRGGVDLPGAVAQLADSGYRRILSEGGPLLHHGLLTAGLVDELAITIAPSIVGGEAPRSSQGDWISPPQAYRPRLVLLADDRTLFLSYVAE